MIKTTLTLLSVIVLVLNARAAEPTLTLGIGITEEDIEATAAAVRRTESAGTTEREDRVDPSRTPVVSTTKFPETDLMRRMGFSEKTISACAEGEHNAQLARERGQVEETTRFLHARAQVDPTYAHALQLWELALRYNE